MGRRRKAENSIYPEGVYRSRGWLFYHDKTTGKWPKVCRVEEWESSHPQSKAARDRWALLSTGKAANGTVAAMLQGHLAYREQLVRQRQLAARTYEDNVAYAKPLMQVFGAMLPHEVTTRHCTGYLRKRSWRPPARDGMEQSPRLAPVRANKEMSFLSSTYTWALSSPEWPQVTSNPCIGAERNPTKAKERCPEVWELEAAKQYAPDPWPWILDLAYKVGQRGVQLRQLPKTAIRREGIFVGKAKGGADIFIEWDGELMALILALLARTEAIEAQRGIVSPYVIVARTGTPFTTSAPGAPPMRRSCSERTLSTAWATSVGRRPTTTCAAGARSA
jgi:hypothetical protein